jgi:hypothetical protein
MSLLDFETRILATLKDNGGANYINKTHIFRYGCSARKYY